MKTNAQRQAAFRARKAATPEVRGIFAPKELHQILRSAAKETIKMLLDKQKPV